MRIVWFRFRATWRQRWGGYLAITLLIGLVGGLAMGSIAAARRTSASFTVFWESTNPSELVGATAVLNPTIKSYSGYSAAEVKAIARLPGVAQVESQSGIDFLPLQHDGNPLNAPNFYSPAAGNGYGSVDGLYFDQDRVSVATGRIANPNRPDELMLSASGAAELGVKVGDILPVGIYTNAQTQLAGFGTAKVKPIRIVDEKVVGIVFFNTTIIQDDVDAGGAPNNLFTPALTRQLLHCCVNYTESAVRLRPSTSVAAVAAEIAKTLPRGFPPFADSQTTVLSKAQNALKPEAIALGVFGAIVALATLLVAGQLIGRQVRRGVDERAVLRALGAPTTITVSDGLIGVGGAVVLGAVLAAGVAVALSPLAPLGPVRAVYPDRGVAFDWTVLGLGVLTFALALSTLAVAISYRDAPHRRRHGVLERPARPSRLVAAAGAAGIPAPGLTGLRFALESGTGGNAAPVRSAILGAGMAMVALVATVTFGASLNFLVSHPALYGWNWDYMLASGGDIPLGPVTKLLNNDRYVAQWSANYTAALDFDGQSVPVLAENPNAPVAPPILSGHGLEAANEVVLGAVTLAQLHTQIGKTVEVSSGLSAERTLRVVGTAAMPTIGSTGGQHLALGTGALLASQLLPATATNPFDDPIPGPNSIMVRLRSGFPRSVELASLNAVAHATSNTANFGVGVSGVLRPAEIVNYRSLGATPIFLGAGLAAGAIAALALTLIASVRRRRRDLALLKTLGFTSGQLAATVAWQSTIAVVIGSVVGVPVGIALGRWLWDLFARSIHTVPAPTVPALSVVLIAVCALLLANVVAFIPGRLAARTPTALLLRAE
jgi:ABC-type antimicrobial peptide transport system permease subunit